MPENKRALGTEKEDKAAEYLEGLGFKILHRNFRCRTGEIDIIARESGYLVFVEVKYRSSERAGDPAEAVGPAKQKKIFDTARYYMLRYGISADTDIRFDVVAILGDRVTLYRNAFSPV